MRRGSSAGRRRVVSRAGLRAAEALAWLAVARIAVLALPFRVLARALGVRRGETATGGAPARPALEIAWAVPAAARRATWRTECLEQAIAAKAMLRTRGIDSTLYLGVAREPTAAHAWLRVGDLHVTGGQDVSRYAVVASFGEIRRR